MTTNDLFNKAMIFVRKQYDETNYTYKHKHVAAIMILYLEREHTLEYAYTEACMELLKLDDEDDEELWDIIS